MFTCAATVAVLLIGYGGSRDRRDQFASPGALTHAHSSELMSCSVCHGSQVDGEAGEKEIVGHRVTNSSCLACHKDIDPSGLLAGYAHGLGPDTLARSGERASARGGSGVGLLASRTSPLRKVGLEGGLSCASCHREHHGKHHDLAALTDAQCQTCHANKFRDFAHGHPSFAETHYPYNRRTQIVFDHKTHYEKHFGEKAKHAPAGFDPSQVGVESQSCATCHQPDGRGESMRVVSYEAACAACHESSVHGGEPLTVLSLPQAPEGLELAGRWPQSGLGLTPVMLAALSPETRRKAEALPPLPESDQLALSDETPELREASRAVAVEVQQMYFEMWKEGPQALAGRLVERGFQRGGDSDASYRPLSGIGLDHLRRLLFPGVRWELGEFAFPQLDKDALNTWLADQERSIGVWPAGASAPITPLVRYVLGQGEEADAALKILEAGERSLGDLTEASPGELAAAETVAWAIKDLYARLAEEGAPFLEQFVGLSGGILNTQPSSHVLKQVFYAAQDDQAFRAAYREEWLNWRNGRRPPAVEKPPEVAPPPAPKPGGDPGADDNFGSDDDFGEDKPAPAEADDDFGEDKPAPAGADDDFGSDDDFGEDKPAPAAADDDFGSDDDFGEEKPAPGAADDDFGSDDDFGEEKPAPAGADDDFGGDDDFGEEKPDGGESEKDEAPEFSVFEPSSLIDWQKFGGWLHEAHSLKYASRGHADPVLRAWIEQSVRAANSDDELLRLEGRRLLHSSLGLRDGVMGEASGKCFKCHSVDVTPGTGDGQQFRVHWRAGVASDRYPLTSFDHGKHIQAVSCTRCHKMGGEGDYAAQFPGRSSWASPTDPPTPAAETRVRSNFRPMDRLTSCATCHQPEAAGSHCLQCHQYHSRGHGGAPDAPR